MLRRKHRIAVTWMLTGLMALPLSTVRAQPPTSKPRPAAVKLDLGYVTPQTMAVVVAHPRRVLTAPQMEMLPTEIMSAAGVKELGIDPLDIEQIMVIVEPPQGEEPPVAVVVRSTKPFDTAKLVDKFLGPGDSNAAARAPNAELAGRKYHRFQERGDVSLFQPDERTLIATVDAMLRRMVANHAKPQAGAVSQMLSRIQDPPDLFALLLVEPIRPMIMGALSEAPLPPPFAAVKRIPELVSSVAAKANLTGEMEMSLVLRANDEEGAKELQTTIDGLLTLGKQMALAQMAPQAASDDPVEQAMAKYAERMSDRFIQVLRPVRKGNALTFGGGAQSGHGAALSQVAVVGVLVALLLPAIQAAREAARRTQSNNNLKNIVLAFQNHHDAYKTFPPNAIYSKDGKPLLSWRVAILPYLGEQELYDRFHKDEPWDSAHNRTLIAQMPACYRNPSSAAAPGLSDYLAITGPGLLFDGTKGKSFSSITDGTSNTILVVEADPSRAVTWTKPEDLKFDAEQPLAGLGNAHPGGFLVGMVDGSVQFISKTIAPNTFKALLTIAGGESVPY